MDTTDSINSDRQQSYGTEYQDLGNNYRFHVGLRFIVAAFTATLQSALFTFYGQALQRPTPPIPLNIIFVAGIIIMIAIGIIERRNMAIFSTIMKRGKELEFNLGLIDGQYSKLGALRTKRKHFPRIITHTNGIILIYGMIFILWFALLIRDSLPWIRSFLP